LIRAALVATEQLSIGFNRKRKTTCEGNKRRQDTFSLNHQISQGDNKVVSAKLRVKHTKYLCSTLQTLMRVFEC
jgi:hypothetical protein